MNKSISKKITLYIIAASSMITFFAISFFLLDQYKKDIDLLDDRLDSIRKVSLLTLKKSIWEFDEEQIYVVINGILNLQDVVSAEVITEDWDGGEKRYSTGKSLEVTPGSYRVRRYPIMADSSYRAVDTNKKLGELVVTASLEGVYHRLWEQARFIIFSQVFKTALITLIIIYILNYFLSRHLNQIAEYTRKLKFDSPNERLHLDRAESKGKPTDELDDVVDAINHMQDNFDLFLENQKILEKTEKELKQSGDQLAHMERLYSLGEMAAGMAHEINQPLTAIANYSSASSRLVKSNFGANHEKVIKNLDNISEQADRAGKIVNKLRDFIRKQESEFSSVDLVELVSEALSFCQQESQAINTTISFSSEDKSCFVLADYLQIQQVIINLLRNSADAIRLSRREHGEINVSIKSHDNEYIVSIEDNGIGLDSLVAEKVFFPFFTTKKHGIGIGLAICDTIIRSHNGNISAEAAEIGARFWFTLPKTGVQEEFG